MSKSQSRRAFIGTTVGVVAAVTAAAQGNTSTGKGKPAPSTSNGDTMPVWAVWDKSDVGHPFIDAYGLSQRDAAYVAGHRGEIGGKRLSVRKAVATFSGNLFRLASIVWDGYRTSLFMRTSEVASQLGERSSRADEYTRNQLLRAVAWDEARLQRDQATAEAQGADWAYAKPCHVLDLPEAIEESEDILEPQDFYTSRSEVLKAAAEWNRRQLASTDEHALQLWAIVLEVGDELPGGAVAITSLCGDVGLSEHHTVRPVRLVRPTAEEIAQFAGV